MIEPTFPQVKILSETSVCAAFGDQASLATNREVLIFNELLLRTPLPGLRATVPAYATLTVFFDPFLLKKKWPEAKSPARAAAVFLEKMLAENLLEASQPRAENPPLEIPVRYDGPDLAEVADRLRMPQAEVVRLHTAAVYTVFMVGFLPGFPYLGVLPEALQLPRRNTPRTRVPAGSVAIGGQQTGIYPQASPGGWHLLGRTDFPLFDPRCDPPAALRAGRQVRFCAI
jgi:inhibitor of KinA